MPKKKKPVRQGWSEAVRRRAAARNACYHGWRFAVDPQGREWRYCHRCNLYEIVGLVDVEADEEGA